MRIFLGSFFLPGLAVLFVQTVVVDVWHADAVDRLLIGFWVLFTASFTARICSVSKKKGQ